MLPIPLSDHNHATLGAWECSTEGRFGCEIQKGVAVCAFSTAGVVGADTMSGLPCEIDLPDPRREV
jgi:hypothetical protein